jgi:hypothetical protein
VPVEERSTRSAERCDQHPARSAVARCAGCGRPLCLSCAVPVRGSVLGVECLPEPLGGDATPAARPAGSSPLQLVAGGALLLALVATMLPWSRFGIGSGAFGAWDQPPRWSSLAAGAALVGCLAWGVRRVVLPSSRWMDAAITVLGGLVGAGAILSIWHPPAFTRPWIGPWLALVAGALACGTSLAERWTRRIPSTAPI